MQTRVRHRLVPSLTQGDGGLNGMAAPPGVAIVESGTYGPSRVAWLLTNGALQLLCDAARIAVADARR